jgi:glycosyltransferase involved in cell wall biosynthesis
MIYEPSNNPLVSIIVPNYNHAAFLEKRLQSILQQSMQNFEVICLDDASTDESRMIIDLYAKDKRFTKIYNTANSGSTYIQWNRGLKKAIGKYIWIAESDDFADNHFLEILIEPLEKDPHIGVSFCQSIQIDDKNREMGTMLHYYRKLNPQRWTKSYTNHGIHECSEFFIVKNIIPNASAAVFRHSLLQQTGFVDETFHYCADWKFWITLLQYSDISYCHQPLNFYRTHAQSVRANKGRSIERIIDYYKILHYLKTHFRINEAQTHLLFESIIYKWIDSMAGNFKHIFGYSNQQVYSLASQIDPQLKKRLIRKIPAYFYNKIIKKNP